MSFKRLRAIEQITLVKTTPVELPPIVLELHALIAKVFGETHSTEELRDIFVFPHLELADPNGMVSNVFAKKEIKPGKNMKLDIYRELVRDQVPDQPILIIGHVGSGKSTLVHYTFDNLVDENVFPIFIDFKNVRTDTDSIKKFVIGVINDALTMALHSEDRSVLERVFFTLYPARHAYFDNLAKIDQHEADLSRHRVLEKLQNDLEDWNQARIRYIQEKSARKVYLIFDNVDHHVNADFIQKTIAEGMGQAFTNKCRLIITLRHGNFGFAYYRAAFAARAFTLVELQPPDIQQLIERRVKRVLDGYKDRPSRVILSHFKVSASAYLGIITARLNYLFTPSVLEFLDQFSASNLRRLLMCIRHVFSIKVLSHPEELARSTLSKYDVLENLLRPSGASYLSSEMNPFALALNLYEDGTPREPGNNLIRIRVLQCLQHYGARALSSKLLHDLGQLGYSNSRVKRVLDLVTAQGLVEPGDHSEIMAYADGQDFCHQLTPIGTLYLEQLIYEYRYVLAIKEDTYFSDDSYDRIVGSSSPFERRLDQREPEMMAFDDYIEKMELEEAERCKEPGLLKSVFPRIADKLRAEHRNAIQRLRAAHTQKKVGSADRARGQS